MQKVGERIGCQGRAAPASRVSPLTPDPFPNRGQRSGPTAGCRRQGGKPLEKKVLDKKSPIQGARRADEGRAAKRSGRAACTTVAPVAARPPPRQRATLS